MLALKKVIKNSKDYEVVSRLLNGYINEGIYNFSGGFEVEIIMTNVRIIMQRYLNYNRLENMTFKGCDGNTYIVYMNPFCIHLIMRMRRI